MACTGGSTAWVFVDADPIRSLGPCLAWARQHHIDELHLVVEQDAGVLTRQASQFVDPPTVWWSRDSELERVEPEPLQSVPPPDDAPDLVAMLVDAGLDVVTEHGYHAGEWRGLEVARVREGRLEVGVGSADRELTALVHAGLLPRDALARAVAIVRDERRPGVARHPLNQLVPERWLRWTVCHHPAQIGLDRLDPVASPMPRRGMRERDVAIACAPGHVVVCSVGIDLDLVPAAADARLVIEPEAELVLVVPERDAHHTTRALAAALSRPADVRPFVGDWRL